MRIFVTGSRGQLGRDCLDLFGRDAEAGGLDLPELDIADAGAVERKLSAFQPDVVINAAAYTQVDRAETEPDAARRANAEGPRVLAEYVERHGGVLVHVSTDYVFDGQRPPPRPYVETDPTGPASVYGRTKLAGEEAVRRATTRHVILRTAWLYGASGRGFLRAILGRALANPGAPLRVVSDQYGSPTWSGRLALQIRKALEGGARGLYHAAGAGACTWFDFAAEFLRLLNVPARVEPCPATEYPRPAPRPRNSVLENARLKTEGLLVMRPWAEDLAEFARLYGERWLREAREAKP